ncbi:hypothetical protein NOR_00174 [Metarhizium rileyi]|uniref:Rhodopsin domain-containing protein n=1 Tax=Metarhizium rileyi (strain RCEF 4871) TaxID=1649241 RepID=A0A167KDC8_METRR|nr:hypothetical protein NOR_00174 [Metarhizium rileyi RCEF 4871]TWU75000.1 hypothetical protein ED733_005955 [Metarhizium rileyi]
MSLSTPSSLAVTTSDHGGLIVITAVVGATWTVLVFLIRLYMRLRLNGPFGRDDGAASFATASGLVQVALTLAAVGKGLGRQESLLAADEVGSALKLNYAANLVYIVAICGSKCAMFLLITRLGQEKRHLLATNSVTMLTIIWAVVSLFLMAFQCSLPEPWDIRDSSRCSTLVTRWVVVETFSTVIELSVSALSMTLVWGLSMKTRTKVMVVCAFSAQLFVIIPIVFRLHFVQRSRDTTDATFDSTDVVITTQVVMHFSIMAATFPCFRQFLQAFDSGLGATTKIATERGTGSRSQSSYAMQTLASARDDSGAIRSRARLRPDPTVEIVTEIAARAADRGAEDMSIDSSGSDKAIWTRREWEVHFEARERGS